MTPEKIRELTKDDPLFKESRWATDEEAGVLMNLIRIVGVREVFEVGTANGFTATCMAFTGATVNTFDVADRPKVYSRPEFKDLKINFKHIGSPECFRHMTLPDTKTLFFIDGDHGKLATLRDVSLAWDLARPGDIIVLHDITGERPVFKAWQELKMGRQTEDIKTRNGLGVIRK